MIVCVGSGGVGKTTSSAALALEAARRGRRVLCLTIDPAKRLANSLGLHEMTTEEQEVPRELFEAQGLRADGTLHAMMLDTKRTFDELVGKYASSPSARDRILRNPIYQYVSTSLAGTREYMAMEKLHQVRNDARWDLIVLDTPPTSNALDFLDAPERLSGFLDSPAMGWLVRAVQGGGRLSFDLLNRGARVVLTALGKFTGADFLERVAEFVTGLNDLFGGFRERAARVAADLRAPDVAFVVVTSPGAFAMREALFLVERLESTGLAPKALVVNAVHRPYTDAPPTDAAFADALGAHVDASMLTPALFGGMRQALHDEATRGQIDRTRIDAALADIRGRVPVVEVPAFDDDVHDLAGLAAVAEHLVSEANP
ncbi:MAG: ArsA family ATPase [Myxococcales bacterium]|nr:ArsA family ATPase [Myxococcales bacterium]